MEPKNNREKSSGQVDRGIDIDAVLQQIDKDVGDINWISDCKRIKKQRDELISKQSWLEKKLLDCRGKKRLLIEAR